MCSHKAFKPVPTFEIGESCGLILSIPVALIRHIGNEYKILYPIGEGAYGLVAAALHTPTGTKVAIKRITPFDHTLLCLRTLRELKLLKFFSQACVNDNVG